MVILIGFRHCVTGMSAVGRMLWSHHVAIMIV
jgi:hypothetical protein